MACDTVRQTVRANSLKDQRWTDADEADAKIAHSPGRKKGCSGLEVTTVPYGYARARQGMGVLLALSLCSARHAPEFTYLHTTTAHPRIASRALSGLEVGHSILANDPTFPLPERDTWVLMGDRSHLARHLAPDHNLTPWHNRRGGDDLTGRRGNYSACRSRLGRGRSW